MPKIYRRVCDYCNKQYKGFGKMYCSHRCRNLGDEMVKEYARRGRVLRWEGDKKRGKNIDCKNCGKKKYEYPYKLNTGDLFCSRKCANEYNASKQSVSKAGENNPMYGKRAWNYIDGKPIHLYSTVGWIAVRDRVRERDNNTCRRCSSNGEHVHHRVPYRKSKDNSMSNLVLLCRSCHSFAEAKYVQEGVVVV